MNKKSVLRLAYEASQFEIVEILRDAGAREWPYEAANIWSACSFFNMPMTRDNRCWILSTESDESI
jgi:hypothetical protein